MTSSSVSANGHANDLSWFLHNEILPKLDAEEIYTDPAHAFLKTDRDKWRGGCPWHQSKSGTSFVVTPSSRLWWCAGCSRGGGPVEYVHFLRCGHFEPPRGLDFVRAVKHLAELAGVEMPERELTPEQTEALRKAETRRAILQATMALAQEHLQSEHGEAARTYLTSRGFTAADAENLGIGLFPGVHLSKERLQQLGFDLKDLHDTGVLNPTLDGYVLIPWADEHGRPLTIYGRYQKKEPPAGLPKTTALPGEGTKRSPLYFDRARRAGHQEVHLVEGVLDAALLQVRGDTKAVACVAAQLSHEQSRTLARHRVKAVTIILDPDGAGDSGTESCLRSLARECIAASVAPWLPDGMDPDEFVLAKEIDAWYAHVAKADPAHIFRAKKILGGVTATHERKYRRRVAEDIRNYVAQLQDPLDIDDVVDLASAQIGYPPEHLGGAKKETQADAIVVADEWDPPLPLGEAPEVLPFPMDAIPVPLQRYITEGARALNVPPDYLAVPMLAIAGGCIGNSCWLKITNSHEQPPALYACVVSSPGAGKTPALKLVEQPLERAQRIFQKNWDNLQAQVSEDDDDAKAPPMRRCHIGDTTTETLTLLLADNPRGMAMVRDELAGLLTGMNQYKSGGGHDRQFYLELWSNSLAPRDRKTDQRPPIFLNRPLVSIVGGTQPDVVERFRGEPNRRGAPPPNDGFLDRWLFAYPAELPTQGETWLEVSPEAMEVWNVTVLRLLALDMVNEGGNLRPFFLHFTRDARRVWETFTGKLAAELNKPGLPGFPGHLKGVWAKLRGYGGRLALIVQMLAWASGEIATKEVEEISMQRASMLVDYFGSHAKKVFHTMQEDYRVPKCNHILEWIVRKNCTKFKRHEVHKDLESAKYFPKIESLDAPLELLIKLNYLKIQDPTPPGGRGGRPSAPVYVVSPLWQHRVNRVNRENVEEVF